MKDIIIILVMFAAAIFGLPLLCGGWQGAAVPMPETAVSFPETVNISLAEGGIVTVSAEEYLEGCIAAQIPINYELEALKAQASAAATYAARLMLDLSGSGKLPDGADISDDPQLCQPYYTPAKREEEYGADYERFREKIQLAAQYGKSHILTKDGEPIYAVYHSVSAGRTCPSEYIWGVELDYLKAAESYRDREFINFECVNEMRSEEARLALIRYDPEIEIPADPAKWFTELRTNEEGYVISVNIGKNTFSGGDIWRIFGLRSTAFAVSYADGIFTFTTKGHGHGAGLSQYGANEMAKAGKTAGEILSHYYSGI